MCKLKEFLSKLKTKHNFSTALHSSGISIILLILFYSQNSNVTYCPSPSRKIIWINDLIIIVIIINISTRNKEIHSSYLLIPNNTFYYIILFLCLIKFMNYNKPLFNSYFFMGVHVYIVTLCKFVGTLFSWDLGIMCGILVITVACELYLLEIDQLIEPDYNYIIRISDPIRFFCLTWKYVTTNYTTRSVIRV